MRDFTDIVEEHQHRVYTFSYYCLGNRHDAEDVTQEVLLRLWRNWDKVKSGSVGPWLTRVTKNACVDAIRRRRSYEAMVTCEGYETALAGAADYQADPSWSLDASDMRKHLMRALGRLDEPYRSIVILREIQGMTYNEIGDALEMPVSRVKVHLHRGRKMLRNGLRERVGHG